jgi:hypothetical protein
MLISLAIFFVVCPGRLRFRVPKQTLFGRLGSTGCIGRLPRLVSNLVAVPAPTPARSLTAQQLLGTHLSGHE